MSRFTSLFVAGLISLMVTAVTAGELAVNPDKENVVASRIEGKWRTHGSLTHRLTGRAEARPGSMVFRSDPAVAGLIPDRFAKVLGGRGMKAYLAGYVTVDDKDRPFLLTQTSGNPHVLIWLERDGDPFGKVESFNVMLAVAEDRQNDLLFVGGDFNNQAFSAFERAKIDVGK